MATAAPDEGRPPSPSISVRILSQLSSPSDAEFTIDHISLQTTTDQLKQRIQNHVSSHPPPQAQRLIYRGRHLNNPAQTIQDICGAQASEYVHTFHLVVQQTAAATASSASGQARLPTAATLGIPNPITPASQQTNARTSPIDVADQPPEIAAISSIVDNVHRLAQNAGMARDNQPQQAFLLTDPSGQNRGIIHSGQIIAHGLPPNSTLPFGGSPFPFGPGVQHIAGLPFAQAPHFPPSPTTQISEQDPARRTILADEVASASRALSQMNLRLAEANEAYAQAMRSLAVVNSMATASREPSGSSSAPQQARAPSRSSETEALLERFRRETNRQGQSDAQNGTERHRTGDARTPELDNTVRVAAPQQAEQFQDQGQQQEEPPAQNNANLEQLIAGPVGQLWLAFRVGLFIYFFAGGASWTRLAMFTIVGVIYWLSQSPYFAVFRDQLQRHFESLVTPRDSQAPSNAQAVPGTGRPMPSEQETAARLLEERRARDTTWARERLRVFERAIALFLVSLWPGENAQNLRQRLQNQNAVAPALAAVDQQAAQSNETSSSEQESSTQPDANTTSSSSNESETKHVATDTVGEGSSTGIEAAGGEGLTRRHENSE